MPLTNRQKKVIKKRINKLRLDEIAAELDVPEKIISKYLMKIWRKDKYKRYIEESASKIANSSAEVAPLQMGFLNSIRGNKNLLLAFGLLVFLVYANGLNNDFVSDDLSWIPNNPRLGDISVLLAFPNRVAMWAVFFIVHAIGGLNPLFYRLSNVLFHLGSTLTIYLLFNLLYGRRLAFMVGSLFAVHPILVESVTWIAGASYAEYSFFLLLSLLLYVLSRNHHKLYYYSLATFILSLLFSEQAVVLGIVFFLYELSFGSLQRYWKRLIPYFALTAILAFILFTRVGERISGLQTYNYLEPGRDNPLLQIPIAITEYLKLIFWPKDLTLYHSEMSFTWEQYWVRLVIFLALAGVIFYAYLRSRRNHPEAKFVFFWLAFFLVTLAPTLTPFRISWIVAERYAYLGSLGILAVIGLLFKKISDQRSMRALAYVIFAVIILLLSARTIVRNGDWKNEDTLWIATAKTSPSSPNTHNNMGDVYARQGELEKAVTEFQKAIEIKPNYADAYHNLANTQQKLAEQNSSVDYLEEAIKNYHLAIQYNPNLWQSHQNLGAIYFNQEMYDDAAAQLEQAVKINSTNLNLRYYLGVVYKQAGKDDLAKEQFLSILSADPNNPTVLEALQELR